jgi:hypothetical protein
MSSSYLNIVTFLFTTLFYYLAIKPTLTYDVLVDPLKYKQYMSNSYMFLAIYLLLVIVIQFLVNSSIISSTCGGNITENMGAAGIFTFLPWVFIFGVLMVVLIIYPGFKSAFADVVGYFWVSSSANTLLTELLINPEIQSKIDGSIETPEKKIALQSAADTILKICGNTSILINQMVPSNFNSYWDLLTPLMKKDNSTNIDMKNKLFELVVTRDTIGESMWYIYTGLLITSIVQLKIATRGCASNPKTMEQNYHKFLDSEKQAKQKSSLATSSTYTITN